MDKMDGYIIMSDDTGIFDLSQLSEEERKKAIEILYPDKEN